MDEKKPRPVIVMITMDRETSSAILTRSDGKEAWFPLGSSPFADSSVLSSYRYAPAVNGLLATTQAGDDIVFELPTEDAATQLDGRLIVYLDQNQWSTVSKARYDPSRVGEEDCKAAEQLSEWVQQRRIVLPASSGHYTETTKWASASARYQLGLTVLQLSRGWQMRDPLQVRRNELNDALRLSLVPGASAGEVAVFTLKPNVIHGPSRGSNLYSAPSDFTQEMQLLHEALTSATTLIDVMLDSEWIEPIPAPSALGWARVNQEFSDWLDGEELNSQQKRKCIDALLLSDLRMEIAEEGHAAEISVEEFRQWTKKRALAAIETMPSLGLFREMLQDRHLNRGTTWRSNDLTDMVYLSCAAGYSDFVVCERLMGSLLQQGLRRLGRQPNVFRRLCDAVPEIEAALAGRTM